MRTALPAADLQAGGPQVVLQTEATNREPVRDKKTTNASELRWHHIFV